MRNHKLLRNLGLTAIALIAIGAVAYAAGSEGGGAASDEARQTAAGSPAASRAGDFAATAGFGGDGAVKSQSLDFDDAREVAPSAESGVAAAGAPDSGPVPGGANLASAIDRKIVSTASIQMQVDDVGGGFEEVGRIATSVGGFVASSSFTYQGEDQLASVTIRVPSDSYQGVLSNLRKLGVKIDYENSDAYDVTEEYTDLGSRLRTLEATETQLLTLLGRAKTISDILTVQDRLNYTRGEIEQVKGRMQLLDDLTALATITAHLRPVVAGGGTDDGEGVDLGAEVAEAWDESIEFLGEIAAGVVTVVVFAWWVPLAGLPLLFGYKAMSRRHPQAATADID